MVNLQKVLYAAEIYIQKRVTLLHPDDVVYMSLSVYVEAF